MNIVKQQCLLILFVIISNTLLAQFSIDGPTKVCRGKTVEFSILNPQTNHTYYWSGSAGAIVLQPTGLTTTILFDQELTTVITVVEKDSLGNILNTYYKEVPVKGLPNPKILSQTRVGCEQLNDPNAENPSNLFLDETKCHKVCSGSIVAYEAFTTNGNTYSWSVTGGSIVGSSTSAAVHVQWGG
jgi:hypothetical protein